jgi:hypothetical protein
MTPDRTLRQFGAYPRSGFGVYDGSPEARQFFSSASLSSRQGAICSEAVKADGR